MKSIKDDRGYNQGFALSRSTMVRMKRRTDLILSHLTITSQTQILEIGCGTGEVSYWMASQSPARVLGTDLCAPFIEEAKKKYQLPNLQYEVIDFNDPGPLSGVAFDYIVGNGILHHLYHNLNDAFISMLRLLKKEGKILFLEPNIHNPYVYLIFSYPRLRTAAKLEPSEMAFSKRFITDALSRAGFVDVQVDYKDFLLPGIPDFLIKPSIAVGAVLEKLPLFKQVSQSLFIRARKSSSSEGRTKRGSTHMERISFLLRYGISGATAVAIQVIGLYLWVSVFGLEREYLWGVIVSYGVALAVAFVMQKYWTFRNYSREAVIGQALWYTSISLVNLGLNAFLLYVSKLTIESQGVNFFDIWYLVAQAFAAIICASISLLCNQLITFRSAR